MKQDTLEQFTDQQQEALKSIRISRVILPALIGVMGVGYLLWRQFDPEEFAKIRWTTHTWLWIGAGLLCSTGRHLSYSYRLRTLSQGVFSWWKCIELIFIWEFSSAVSPTSLGGSTVAFFILSQEKLSTAKTATIVLYTVVLDSLFLLSTLPLLFLLFGSSMMRPDAGSFAEAGGWGIYFIFAYGLMLTYSSIFYYGIFVDPVRMKRVLAAVTRLKPLRRYFRKAVALGNDMVIASNELKQQRFGFHLRAFLSTAGAWTSRFLLLNCLIIALVPEVPRDFLTQFELYARLETMFFIIAFSPTPGGAGLIEVLFNGFMTDYVTNTTHSTTIATIWRLMSYYIYLLAGAIVIPNWIRNLINERRKRRGGERTEER